MGNNGNSGRFYLLGLPNHGGDCSHEIKRLLLLERKAMMNIDSILKSREITLLTKLCIVKAMVFPVVMYGWALDHKEDWALKNWCFQTVVLEKTLESPLDCREIKSVNPKWNQPWTFIGRTDAKAESPILWPPDGQSQLIGKDPDAEKDWRQEEKGTTGWYGWMASLTQRTWVWADSGRSWRIGRPGMLQSLGSQRVEQDLMTEQQQQGSFVHGILQAKNARVGSHSLLQEIFQPRDQTQVSCTASRFFTTWDTREAHQISEKCESKLQCGITSYGLDGHHQKICKQ